MICNIASFYENYPLFYFLSVVCWKSVKEPHITFKSLLGGSVLMELPVNWVMLNPPTETNVFMWRKDGESSSYTACPRCLILALMWGRIMLPFCFVYFPHSFLFSKDLNFLKHLTMLATESPIFPLPLPFLCYKVFTMWEKYQRFKWAENQIRSCILLISLPFPPWLL